jgi:hypothetical protein
MALILIPLLIGFGVLYLIMVSKIFLPFLPDSPAGGYFSFFSNWSTVQHHENVGFTAEISSYYDGDACLSHLLQFDTDMLPELFRSLNIRILGIDAPELRSAKCDLEH